MSVSIKIGNNNYNTLGERIKFFRQRAEISQIQLELRAGISVGSLTRIERNKVSPTKETIAKIGTVLKLNAMELAYLYEVNLYIKRLKSEEEASD